MICSKHCSAKVLFVLLVGIAAGSTALQALDLDIVLPPGLSAPQGGLELEIILKKQNQASVASRQVVRMPAGQSRLRQAVQLPAGQALVLQVNTAWSELVRSAWWTGSQAAWRELDAIPLSSTPQLSQIELVLLRGLIVSGKLRLPAGELASRTSTLMVHAWQAGGEYPASCLVTLPAGQNGAAWQLRVPASRGQLRHTLRYSGCTLEGYRPELPESYHFDSFATVISPQTRDLSGQDIFLSPLAKVRGRVALPAGKTAPPGGLAVTIRALQDDFFRATHVQTELRIPAGQNSVDYQLAYGLEGRKPEEAFWICYVVDYHGMVKSGYWSETGMVRHGILPANGKITRQTAALKPYNLTIIADSQANTFAEDEARGKAIAAELGARLTRSHWTDFEKLLASFEWVTANVLYWTPANAARCLFPSIDIVETGFAPFVYKLTVCGGFTKALDRLTQFAGLRGETATNYAHGWNRFRLDGIIYHVDATVSHGGYQTFMLDDRQYDVVGIFPGRAPNREPAASLFVFDARRHMPHASEMRDPARLRFFGTIKLPAGEKAPRGGITVSMRSQKYFIPEGESQISFFHFVSRSSPPEVRDPVQIVEYSVDSGLYLPHAYWTAQGPVHDVDRAQKIPTNADDILNAVIQLESAPQVRGQLSIPSSLQVPATGLEVTINLTTTTSRHSRGTTFLVLPGDRSVPFALPCPNGAEPCVVSYRLQNQTGVLEFGYAAGAKTVSRETEAIAVVTYPPGSPVNLTILTGRVCNLSIQLPPDLPPMSGAVNVSCMLYDLSGANLFRNSVRISRDQSRADCTINLDAVDQPLRLQVRAFYDNPQGRSTALIPALWLGTDGLVSDPAKARNLTGADFQSGIPVQLHTGQAFTGGIRLGSATRQQNGLSYRIEARAVYTQGRGAWFRVDSSRVNQGSDRQWFAFRLAWDRGVVGWQLRYLTDDAAAVQREGYWTERGTLFREDQAGTLGPNSTLSDLELFIPTR